MQDKPLPRIDVILRIQLHDDPETASELKLEDCETEKVLEHPTFGAQTLKFLELIAAS